MAIIGGLLIFNAIVGFSQDHHANSVVDALRRTLKNTAVVLRDGRLQEIETRMIVPGDLVKLEEVSTANYSVAYMSRLIQNRGLCSRQMAVSLPKTYVCRSISRP